MSDLLQSDPGLHLRPKVSTRLIEIDLIDQGHRKSVHTQGYGRNTTLARPVDSRQRNTGAKAFPSPLADLEFGV